MLMEEPDPDMIPIDLPASLEDFAEVSGETPEHMLELFAQGGGYIPVFGPDGKVEASLRMTKDGRVYMGPPIFKQ
jgi:hypothetical protein